MTANGADCSQLLSIPPPFVNTEPLLLLAQKTELHVDVVEVPPQGASGALYDDRAALEGDVDILGNVDRLVAENGLHPETHNTWGEAEAGQASRGQKLQT